ncbi:MAG: glycosyltransferase [Gemmatimonadetes bacterium]|nr:glycosyltransferase [Gemmatimonadota bacterium]
MSHITSKQNVEQPPDEAAPEITAATRKTEGTAATPKAEIESRPLTYLFTGGGTGGHVYPGLAIADEVRSRNPEARIVYVGARGRMEASLVPKRGYPIHLVHARGLPSGRQPLALLRFAVSTGFGVLQSLFHLLRHRPRMIVATGGYASSPVLLAHWILKSLRLSGARRCFVHEQNVVPGKVNRLAGRIADRIGVSFEASLGYFPPEKTTWAGYPVRREIGAMSRDAARASQGLPADAKVVFAFGASSGARSINRAVVDALPGLLSRPDIHVIHVIGQTRSPDYDAKADTRSRLERLGLAGEHLSRYHQSDYSHEIETLYAASDLVIGRASAGVVTEIGICGIPSILVPLPYAPGDHQAVNARTLESRGAARVVYESISVEDGQTIGVVDGERLARLVLEILDDPAGHAVMSRRARETFDRNGLDRIVDQLDQMLAVSQARSAHPDRADDPDRPADHARSNGNPDEMDANDAPEPDEPAGPGDPGDPIVPPASALSPFALVRRFAEGRDEAFIEFVGEDYLKYRVDGFLKDGRWPIRNEGVKLAGLLGYRDRLPFILTLLRDRTPAPFFQRLLGGDYRQVGFIRRNAVTAIGRLGVYDAPVRAVLLDLLADPYYEVRSAAALAFADLAHGLETADADWERDEEVLTGLRGLLRESSFEIRSAAIRALGRMGDGAVTEWLRPFYQDPNGKVRQAVIDALADLVRRKMIVDLDSIREELDEILVTSNHFEPDFPIRRTLNRLIGMIRNQQEAP